MATWSNLSDTTARLTLDGGHLPRENVAGGAALLVVVLGANGGAKCVGS
jgi:hypothetical protein